MSKKLLIALLTLVLSFNMLTAPAALARKIGGGSHSYSSHSSTSTNVNNNSNSSNSTNSYSSNTNNINNTNKTNSTASPSAQAKYQNRPYYNSGTGSFLSTLMAVGIGYLIFDSLTDDGQPIYVDEEGNQYLPEDLDKLELTAVEEEPQVEEKSWWEKFLDFICFWN